MLVRDGRANPVPKPFRDSAGAFAQLGGLERCLCKFGNVLITRKRFAALGKYGLEAGFDKLFGRSDSESWIGVNALFHPPAVAGVPVSVMSYAFCDNEGRPNPVRIA